MTDDFEHKPMPNLPAGYGVTHNVVYSFELMTGAYEPLEQYLQGLYPNDYLFLDYVGSGSQNGSIAWDVKMNRVLSAPEVDEMASRIAAWTVPDVWYTLDRTISYPAYSEYVNDATPRPTQTFININRRTDTYGLNAIKTVAEYGCDDVRLFAGKTTGTVTFELYNVSRDWLMVTVPVDIGQLVQTWAAEAAAAPQDGGSPPSPIPSSVFRSVMLGDLWSKSVNYDTIWQIRVGVDNPDVKIRVHGLQYLYYNRNVNTE